MIKANCLVKNYGEILAVDDVTFEVKKGDILGFLGPNGAGKSTTMKMLTGFLPPTAGTSEIGGHVVQQAPIEAKKLFGYLPESGPLYPEMTVTEFLGFVADMRGLAGAERSKAFDRVIEVCHLATVRRQPIETLSKGYRQRVGMAQAILHDPPALIMDEPTDGLDPNQKREVRKLIASMAEEKAIILSTHILEEVEAMCSRVIIIDEGRIKIDETTEEVRKRDPQAGCVIVEFTTEEDNYRRALKDVAAVKEVETADGGGFLVTPRNGDDLVETLWSVAREKSWPIKRLESVPFSMEAIFQTLTTPAESKD